MTTAAEKSHFEFLPPTLDGKQEVKVVQANTAAQSINLFDHLDSADRPTSERANLQLHVKCDRGDSYVAFKQYDGNAASVTVNTGLPLMNGQSYVFWVNANRIDALEYITNSGTAYIHFYVCSPHY